MIKEWNKESPIIKEIFYNARCNYITQIISTQDDKDIDLELCTHSIRIFTTSHAATSHFARITNGVSKADKKHAEICIKRIFSESDSKNYKKLVYSPTDNDPFMYMIADLYDNIRIGFNSMWNFDKK
jgi:hypothetical protein